MSRGATTQARWYTGPVSLRRVRRSVLRRRRTPRHCGMPGIASRYGSYRLGAQARCTAPECRNRPIRTTEAAEQGRPTRQAGVLQLLPAGPGGAWAPASVGGRTRASRRHVALRSQAIRVAAPPFHRRGASNTRSGGRGNGGSLVGDARSTPTVNGSHYVTPRTRRPPRSAAPAARTRGAHQRCASRRTARCRPGVNPRRLQDSELRSGELRLGSVH